MKHILCVEDDVMIASGLKYALEQEQYRVTHCKCLHEAVDAIARESFDLALLDMQLPDGTGFDVREALRGTEAAILFLTVVDDEGNMVRAFESGADDYVTKPFRLRELLARIKRILERYEKAEPPGILKINRVSIDTSAGKVFLGEELVELTALEYRLLLTFASNKGLILTRPQILENIWDTTGNYVEDNTLTVYIKRLREKLGDNIHIETIRGLGYRAD